MRWRFVALPVHPNLCDLLVISSTYSVEGNSHLKTPNGSVF